MPDLTPTDLKAAQAVAAVHPEWIGLARAGDAVGLADNTLLHAGPPFASAKEISRPILHSACVAAVFQGLTDDLHTAEEAIAAGDILLEPAQDYDVVTPLAGVVARDSWLQIVADRANGDRRAFSPLNGGMGPAPRLGLRSAEALDHYRWMNGELADVLGRALGAPIDLVAHARVGLGAGDDLHGRTPVATADLAAILDTGIGSSHAADRVRSFLKEGPSFFLNLWMASCKCMMLAAVDMEGCSIVTGGAGNGLSAGIQVAGLPGRWFTAPAMAPTGRIDGDLPESRALGAIGDSAVVDLLGFGAMAMSYSEVQRQGMGTFMPANGLSLPGLLCAAPHKGFGELGVSVAIAARAVAAKGEAPVISLGILDREGVEGRIGGGIYRPPVSLFSDAVAALGG